MEKRNLTLIVISVLSEVTLQPACNISEDSHLIKDLNLDSVDLVDFSFELDEILKVRVNIFDIFKSSQFESGNKYDPTIKELINFLVKEINRKN